MSDATLYDGVVPKIVDVVRNSSALAAKDTKFYASIDQDLRENFEESSSALLELANKLLNPRSSSPILGYGELEATSDGGWKKVSDCLDSVFEKIDMDIDCIKAPKKEDSLQYLDDSSSFKANFQVKTKPQNEFRIPVDNSDESPFKPKLTSKPHAITPFETSLMLHYDSEGSPYYDHPYGKEIAEYPYPESVLQVSEPIPSLDWQKTKATWVDTVDGLNAMIEELEESTEVAVDLEHHDLRSYYGITCLMQISNRQKDWIIDTLSLRDDMGVLNTIFANPGVVKVFHGASMDIIWLQRDLGLYIVSLFDTYFASKSLGLQRFSLAFLLENFANFKTSKKYQLADWRVRPIPSAMLDYARADTHFLLNIYDVLRNKLVASGDSKLQEVLFSSRKVAARKFEFQKFRKGMSSSTKFSFNDGDTARHFMMHYNIPLSKEQLAVKLFEWRDQIARKYDESPRFIMSNQAMVNICQVQHPVTMQQLKSSFAGNSKILLENSEQLFDLVKGSISDVQQIHNDLSKTEIGKEALTIDSAREMAEIFRGFTNHNDVQSNSPSSLDSISKVSILNNCFTTPIFSVQIPDGRSKPKEVSFGELRNRFEFRRANLESYMINSFMKEMDEEQKIDIIQEEPQVLSGIASDEIAGDQLITLSRKDSQKKSLLPNYEETKSPSFDYKSSEISILSSSEREKVHKKRSFEPYNRQSSSGPRPFKGRKIVQAGKSTSFLKKK